jgi:hypothetical protein
MAFIAVIVQYQCRQDGGDEKIPQGRESHEIPSHDNGGQGMLVQVGCNERCGYRKKATFWRRSIRPVSRIITTAPITDKSARETVQKRNVCGGGERTDDTWNKDKVVLHAAYIYKASAKPTSARRLSTLASHALATANFDSKGRV